MSYEGLPLLTWKPATCQIVPFPAGKRVGKIRRTVEILKERNGKGADHYWNQVVTGMRSQMTNAGLAEDLVEIELRAFADQVFARIMCRPVDGDAA